MGIEVKTSRSKLAKAIQGALLKQGFSIACLPGIKTLELLFGAPFLNNVGYATNNATHDFDKPIVVPGIQATAPVKLPSYVLSALPDAQAFPEHVLIVSDATGGPALCLAKGGAWVNLLTQQPVS